MLYRRLGKYIFLIAGLLLIACSSQLPTGEANRGRILLWHSWFGEEEAALQALLDKFHDVYPDIEVIAAPYNPLELRDEFANQVVQGLGPDLLIGNHLWTPELVDAGFVRQVDATTVDMSHYLSAAIRTLEYQGATFGVPLSVHTSALYFNLDRVTAPPETLSALLEQAQQGHKVALSTNFADAFWGIGAFGGQLLDEQDKIILDEGGFTNWLNWLLEAQNRPNMVISNEEEWLVELFRTGEVDFYVGHSHDLLALQNAIGKEKVGVAPLPSGPHNHAGPLLQTEAIFFSSASSKQQNRRALLLAEFLTNVEQQRKLAQLAGRVPAHSRVRIDRRISPAVAGFVEQSKTAVPFRLLPQLFDVVEQGDDAYMQTLEGLVDASIAIERLTADVNTLHNLQIDDRLAQIGQNQVRCPADEKQILTVWHSWKSINSEVLHQLADRFNHACHLAQIALKYVRDDELFLQVQKEAESENGAPPDLLLVEHQQIRLLHEAGLARPLDDLIDSSFMQRYPPAVSTAMRYENELYGLPMTMNMPVLFYNPTLTDEEPSILSDLLSAVSPTRRLFMAYSPSKNVHWGIGGFGGTLFDAAASITLDTPAFAEWLHWLKEAEANPGVVLTDDEEEAQRAFVNGEAAYLVTDQQALVPLLNQMGPKQVETLPLPAGPEGAAAPLIDVTGLVLSPLSQLEDAALEVAQYLVSAESQMQLMKQAYLVPANSTLNAPESPFMDAFWTQAKTAYALPNQPQAQAILEIGDTIYDRVLKQDSDPQIALAEFSNFIHRTYSTDVKTRNESQLASALADECEDAGSLLIWHSTQEDEAFALEQIAADFGRICPEIQLKLQFVPADEVPLRLAELIEVDKVPPEEVPTVPHVGQPIANSNNEPGDATNEPENDDELLIAPDLILTAHDLIGPLSEERLIKPMESWVEPSTLIPFQAVALDAMHHKGSLYGLPYSMETLALYVNRNLIGDMKTVHPPSVTEQELLQEELLPGSHLSQEGNPNAQQANNNQADLATASSGDQPSRDQPSGDQTSEERASGDQASEETLQQLGDATIYELLATSSLTKPLAMGTSFQNAFWGTAAFGSAQFDLDPYDLVSKTGLGEPAIDQKGLVRWLGWLQANQESPGLILKEDADTLEALFTAGNVAYLVASSKLLPSLRLGLDAAASEDEQSAGMERAEHPLTVLPLPAGPEGEAQPFLHVNGFLLPGKLEETQVKLAVRFAQFASSVHSQVRMANLTYHPPVNALALSEVQDPAIQTIVEQALQSVPVPPRPWRILLEEGGAAMFQHVLEEGETPQNAVTEFLHYLAETPLPSVVAQLEGESLDIDQYKVYPQRTYFKAQQSPIGRNNGAYSK
ncbi:MAG: extracellular solute-binding protein [Chloroflexota bacterium]